jgi:hypothetical protein
MEKKQESIFLARIFFQEERTEGLNSHLQRQMFVENS